MVKSAARPLALRVRSLPSTLVSRFQLDDFLGRSLADKPVEFSCSRHEHGVAINDCGGSIRRNIRIEQSDQSLQFEAQLKEIRNLIALQYRYRDRIDWTARNGADKHATDERLLGCQDLIITRHRLDR